MSRCRTVDLIDESINFLDYFTVHTRVVGNEVRCGLVGARSKVVKGLSYQSA